MGRGAGQVSERADAGLATAFILAHNPDAPRWAPAVTDAPLFLANVLAMPIAYAFTPVWTRVIYTNGAVPPTYNAMPPLKPSQQ